jgi:hypothetical protein
MFQSNYDLKKKELFPKPEITADIEMPDFIINPNFKENINTSSILKNDSKITGGALGQNNAAEPLKDPDAEGIDPAAAIQSGLGLAGDLMTRFNGEPLNRQESNAATLKMAATGAQAGMAVGGPAGAAIGGTLMAGIGIVKGLSDKKKITKQHNKDRVAFLAKSTAQREQEQRIEDGEAEIGKLKSLYKAQLGMNV